MINLPLAGMPFTVAVISVVPVAEIFTTPESLTEAILGLELVNL